MSKRNMSKGYISKDKAAVKDTRKNDILMDKAEKAGKTPAGKPAPGNVKDPTPGKNVKTGRPAGAVKARTGSPGRREAYPEQASGPEKHKMVQKILMLSWILLCGVLLLQIWDLNQTIGTLRDRLDRLTRFAAEQRDRLEQFARDDLDESKPSGSGSDSRGEAWDSERTKAADGEGDSEGSGLELDAAAVNGQGVAHKVYLTFDDGPSDKTEEILDILDKYNVKASFFVVGREGDQAQEAMRKIVEAGHTLGMHSYTHKYDEIYDSVENFAADFQKEQDYLYEVTGVKSMVYRFPGGSSNTVSARDMREFARYLDDQGVRFFDWNISSGDGGSFLVPVETLIENCTATIKDHSTSVVLMHDVAGKTTTREALPVIIETIQAMDDTVLLPITEDTELIQHIKWRDEEKEDGGAIK